MILDHPNHFGQVPIILVSSSAFWSGPNHYGQVQIIEISLEKSNLKLTKIMWLQPKQFGIRPKQFVLLKNNFWTYRRRRHPSIFLFFVSSMQDNIHLCSRVQCTPLSWCPYVEVKTPKANFISFQSSPVWQLYMCWNDELSLTMSWVCCLLKDSEIFFYLICRK